ncbi:DEAD/DEAH box helicase [Kordiimonas sp.]|uniref:DEAD/DEAH box helicase n=1 Tax=Kordiimonas sp. TaxID=1970157 RepID=UPI003A958DCA
MKQFTDLGLAEAILRAVSAEGYTVPTPIQAEVIPAMLAGHDIIGIAQTGTGKTASFVLPLLNKIAGQKDRPAPKTCGALILAPTRELAAQIADNIKSHGQFMRMSVAVVVGGANPRPQINAMAKGVDILVATPGRLEDHMQAGAIILHQTKAVVLDEADQMLDMGFIPAIRRIMGKVPAARQTVLMSATMPKQIRGLAQDFLKNPKEISVTPASKPIERIDQTVLHVSKGDKRAKLVELMSDKAIDRAIVFTRTKHGANKVAQHLEKYGLRAGAIHGNKSQGQRQRTLAEFKSGDVPILVATDIAARGIDVDGVSHVVNFELPNVPEVYVHRIGRTARAGKSGIAITLCDTEERGLLRDIEKLIGKGIASDGAVLPESDDAKPAPTKAGARPARSGNRGGQARRHNATGEKHVDGQPKNKRRRNRNGGKPQGQTEAQGGKQNASSRGGAGARQDQSRDGQARNGEARNGQSRNGQSRNGQSRNGQGKPAARSYRQPGNDGSGAGLARMLGNIDSSQKKVRAAS